MNKIKEQELINSIKDFKYGECICNICNNDIMDIECHHWPGESYYLTTDDAVPVMCTATVINHKDTEVKLK